MKTLNGRSLANSTRAGALIVYAVLFLTVLIFGLSALVIDTGRVRLATQELQGAADAAALAGASSLPLDAGDPLYTLTRAAALAAAGANSAAGDPIALDPNYKNSATGDVVVGKWDQDLLVFTPDLVTPDAVQVTAPRTPTSLGGEVPLFFGGVFGLGTSSSSLSRVACAYRSAPARPSVLLLEDKDDKALDVKGKAIIDILSGGLQVNSNDKCAIKGSGSKWRLTASFVGVTGGACVKSGTISPVPTTGVTAVLDSFESLPEVDGGSLPDLGEIEDQGTYSPGRYEKIELKSKETATLLPGIYFIEENIKLESSAELIGDEVMLFLEEGEIECKSKTRISLTPPLSGTYKGICIYQSPDSDKKSKISGKSVLDIQGVLYAPDAKLELSGKGKHSLDRLICKELYAKGTIVLTVPGLVSTGFDLEGPPTVFLVH